tara:strand:+ start:467 stop:712 length:246 start_codon:yes stop_codon:yes gene_type:complete
MKNYKTFIEDKTLKDIVKREKESSHSGSNTSKSIRTMTKEIKREKSDDVIIVKLSDDGDSVMRVGKDELKKYLKKGYEKLK